MGGVRIKNHACVSSSIIGCHSTIGKWARVDDMIVLGEAVDLDDEVYSIGAVVLPHNQVKSSILSQARNPHLLRSYFYLSPDCFHFCFIYLAVNTCTFPLFGRIPTCKCVYTVFIFHFAKFFSDLFLSYNIS